MTDYTSAPGTSVPPLGLFAGHAAVGPGAQPGAAAYDPVDQYYQITGAGSIDAPDGDAFHCLWQRMAGDFILHARVSVREHEAAVPHRLGWTVRARLDPDAPHVSAVLQATGATLQCRRTAGGVTDALPAAQGAVDILQLERRGQRYRMAVARFGEPLAYTEAGDLDLGANVYVALFVAGAHVQARFSNVRLIVPAPADGGPVPHPLGSYLEILDITSGNRRIIYSAAVPFEAPNWTPDGTALIYNQAGRLYRFDLAQHTPQVLDTGFATHNNNDHVLSFDGTRLGISHHSEEDQGQSVVYTLPSGGGTPRRVTAQSPSYLHGWSPDGRFLVYTGMRAGAADIYRIAVEGGAETRLTNTPGLDDGPEYSPDGRYIYFNSARSGRMQLWRMAPDGHQQEPVTDDAYNNWFPHIAPDGRQIVFLSYGQDVEPGAHPPYKHVYLRMRPAAGGPARVVAYVYGGQGTINVPSWSPDSTQIAFVSNTMLAGPPDRGAAES